ncbi:MAG TPA: site-specific integrase [Methylocella sp.]|nr:site-specific integrase [Methylocella sp.]
MPKITKRFIDSLRRSTGSRDLIYWDEALKGFGVRRKPSGAMSYLVQYRNKVGATRRLALGKAEEITPEQARGMAQAQLTRVRQGADPSAERKAARKAETFKDLIEAYCASTEWARNAASTRCIDASRIERHLRPLLGSHTVESITRKDMEKVFRDIRDGRTAVDMSSGKAHGRIRVTGGEGTARRTLALASAIFSFAVRERHVTANPCFGVDRGRDGSREAIVEDADGYAALFRALADLEAERGIPSAAADALRLIALTGARRGEIVGLKWGNVDLANSRLILQSDQHKTGHRSGKVKAIPLPAAAAAIIATLPTGEPKQLVIRSAKDGAQIDLKKAWAKVRERAGLPPDLTIHGLRHSIASHFAMSGASAPEIQAAMGHANIKTSVRYIHFAEARKNALAERAASVATAGLRAASGEDETNSVIKGSFHVAA